MKSLFLLFGTVLLLFGHNGNLVYILPDSSLQQRGGGYIIEGDYSNGVDELIWITPHLEHNKIDIDNNKFKVPKSIDAGLNIFIVNFEDSFNDYTAKYIHSHRGRNIKKSNISSTDIANYSSVDFEFVPLPLARYMSSRSYSFKLQRNNLPLKNHSVTLTTLSGYKQEYTTNNKGIVKVSLPNDFSDVKFGRRANRPSYFILSSTFEIENKKYHTTFTQPYSVNPTDYWRLVPFGFLVVAIGFLSGLLLCKRFKNG